MLVAARLLRPYRARLGRVARTLGVLVGASACSRSSPPAPAAPPPSSSANVAPAVSVTPLPRAATSASVPTAASSADVAKRKAYLAALATGRRATSSGSLVAAIAAFDDALAIEKDDARAYAERGYARLVAGNIEEAATDLATASNLTQDPLLLAQIWFNRGLVDEKRPEPGNAVFDFFIANRLHPSAAARKKLAGKEVCNARSTSVVPIEGDAAIHAGGWLALGRALQVSEESLGGSDESARKELIGRDDDPTKPVVAVAHPGEATWQSRHYLVTKHAANLDAVYVGGTWGSRCGGEASFEVASVLGSRVHVHGRELGEGGYAFMCSAEDGDTHPCRDGDMGAAGMSTQSYCAGGTAEIRDLVIDTATSNVLMVIERPELPPDTPALVSVEATMQSDGLKLAGGGCDRVVGWAADAGPGKPALPPTPR